MALYLALLFEGLGTGFTLIVVICLFKSMHFLTSISSVKLQKRVTFVTFDHICRLAFMTFEAAKIGGIRRLLNLKMPKLPVKCCS
jgi:hypothetical protein